MSQQRDDLFPAGHIIGAFGVRGQIKVFSHTSPRENIVNYSPWVVQQGGLEKRFAVQGGRQGKNVIARLEGVSTREQAVELTGAKILIHRDQLPQLEEGDFYWSQLEGLQVMNTQGEHFGGIDHMLETGANDVMVVQGDRERLIPFVLDEVVKKVDLDQQLIIVDWDTDY